MKRGSQSGLLGLRKNLCASSWGTSRTGCWRPPCATGSGFAVGGVAGAMLVFGTAWSTLVLFTEDLGQQLRLHLDGRTRGALFESNRAAPFTPRRIQQIVKEIARQAGVAKKIHPHTYRHSMATLLRNQGVPLDVVQLLLGHENPRTTQLYARLSMTTAREEYDRAMRTLSGTGRTLQAETSPQQSTATTG